MFKVLPSKSIPVISAGHEEFTSKNGGLSCVERGCSVSSPGSWTKSASATGVTLRGEGRG